MAEARELHLITFRVGSETFVLDIMAVRQIMTFSGATPVPTAPSFVEGIIVLRGEVIPIIDLRERFGIDTTDRTRQPLVLITDTEAGPIGVKVDEVRRIVNVPSDVLLEPPPHVRGIRGDLLIAIVPQGDEVFLLIDVENILSSDEKSQLQSVDLSSSSSAGTSER